MPQHGCAQTNRSAAGRCLRAGIAALFLAGAAAADGHGAVELLEAGVICDIVLEGRREAPLTESGVLNLVRRDRHVDVVTTRVPAVRGLSFGIRVQARRGVPDQARLVLSHPPMGAARVRVQSWNVPLTAGEPALNMFTFEQRYEMVQGRWTFELRAGNDLLARSRFDVVPAGTVPEVAATCFGGPPVS